LEPLQGEVAKLLVPADAVPAHVAAGPRSLVFIHDGKAFRKSDAVLRALAALGGIWKLSAVLRLIPRFLRDAIYDLVSRNRYRWFGRLKACRAPVPGDARFLP
jgi:predicted DCC family thiol-disulfide oxidoreductase YuxK